MKSYFFLICILSTSVCCTAQEILVDGRNGYAPSNFIKPGDFSKSDYTFSCDANGMKISVNKSVYYVDSRFSDSGGKWVKFDGSKMRQDRKDMYKGEMSSQSWKVSRRIELLQNHIAVFDTISNTTNKLIAVRLDNFIRPVGDCSPLSTTAGAYQSPSEYNGPERPFVHVISQASSLGMIARDDVYRNQCVLYGSDNRFGIKDDNFGLGSNESYTIKWELYPCQTDNYYEFINRVRNAWGTDKALIPQLFAFIYPHWKWSKNNKTLYQMNVEEIRDWLNANKVDAICFVVMSDDDPNLGRAIEAFGDDYIFNTKLSREYWHKVVDKLKDAKPDLVVVPYTHFGVGTPGLKGYDDCRVMLKGDEPKLFINYRGIRRDFFYPTSTNKFGKLMNQMFAMIEEEWGPKMYLDESSMGNVSVYMYNVPDWDGHSVDINSVTNEPTQKITNLALITRSYSDTIMDKMISCNWLPTTERDTARMIPSFIEYLHSGTAPRAHLTTPIYTGGQNARSNADVAKGIYEALSQGLLYFHIGMSAYAEKTPSMLGHFYPITVKEIWPGTIIGPEKIITCRSGFYGFNEDSDMDAFIYDANGIIKNDKGRPFVRDHKKYTDVQLNAGEIAIIKKGKNG